MRKTGAIVVTSFYLLLTTGLYACLLHCSADYLMTRLATQQTLHSQDDRQQAEQDDKDDCRSGDCNCCYHHGTYVVVENYSTSFNFQFATTQVALVPLIQERNFYVPDTTKNSISWPRATGPPYLPREPLYIANRTLLI